MAVTLKKLTGSEMPAEHRRPGLDVLFAVQDEDGSTRYLESEVEAASLVVGLSDEERAE